MASESPDGIGTEILIVGTGPIGCTYARCLVQAGHQVVMVEAGAQLSARPGAHLKNAFVYQRDIDRFTPIVQGLLQPISVPSGQPSSNGTLDPISFRVSGGIRSAQNPEQNPERNLSAAAVAYGVGGMFTHWTNNTPRYHPTFERVPYISESEWGTLYSLAEQLLNTRTDVFSGSVRHMAVLGRLQQHYGNRLLPPYGVQALPVAGERRIDNNEFVTFTGSDTILGPLIDRPDLYSSKEFAILPEHRATKLVKVGDRIDYVEVVDLMNWKSFQVHAEIVIVAAGSLLTPQILWKSGIRPPALGRYLTEHPMTFTQVVLNSDIVERIRAESPSQSRLAEPRHSDPVPIPMNDPPPMVWIPLSDGRPWHSQVHRDSFQYGQLPPDVDDRLVVDLRWFGRVDIQRENRITFSDIGNDKLGMPKPIFDFALSGDDRRRTHEMMIDMIGCAHALGGFLPGAEPRFMPLGSSLHFLGTYRMGEVEDDTCVVDPWSKVWGLDNLYLGGNGITPMSTASNPSLTSIAMALRSAASILKLSPGQLQKLCNEAEPPTRPTKPLPSQVTR